MTRKVSQQELNMLKALKKLPFDKKDLEAWSATINDSGFNEDMAKDIKEKMSALESKDEDDNLKIQGKIIAVNRAIQTWRLSENVKSFKNPRNRR